MEDEHEVTMQDNSASYPPPPPPSVRASSSSSAQKKKKKKKKSTNVTSASPKKEGMPGAASLMSMFEPPNGSGSAAGTTSTPSSNAGAGAASLMGMFAPPPGQTSGSGSSSSSGLRASPGKAKGKSKTKTIKIHTISTGNKNENNVSVGSNTSSLGSNNSSQSPATPRGAAALMGMFAQPNQTSPPGAANSDAMPSPSNTSSKKSSIPKEKSFQLQHKYQLQPEPPSTPVTNNIKENMERNQHTCPSLAFYGSTPIVKNSLSSQSDSHDKDHNTQQRQEHRQEQDQHSYLDEKHEVGEMSHAEETTALLGERLTNTSMETIETKKKDKGTRSKVTFSIPSSLSMPDLQGAAEELEQKEEEELRGPLSSLSGMYENEEDVEQGMRHLLLPKEPSEKWGRAAAIPVMSEKEQNGGNIAALQGKLSLSTQEKQKRQHLRHRPGQTQWWKQKLSLSCLEGCSAHDVQMTLVGGGIYTLYHVVFSLALASTLHPQHLSKAMLLAPCAKLFCLGAIVSCPILLVAFGSTCPATFPTLDLFAAPFFTQMSIIVDETMYQTAQENQTIYDETRFLATFSVLSGMALLMTAGAAALSTRIKLANLGAFLPYAVLCGFFSAISLSLWTLAISVDTGMSVQEIVHGGHVWNAIFHHVPSLLSGIGMYLIAGKSPLLVPCLALGIVVSVYLVMGLCHVTLEEAEREGWFWTKEELTHNMRHHDRSGMEAATSSWWWIPPAPFGVIGAIFKSRTYVNYTAIWNGFPTAMAMAVIYFLRSYVHAVAFGKNSKSQVEELSTAHAPRTHLQRSSSVRIGDVSSPSMNSVGSEDGERQDLITPHKMYGDVGSSERTLQQQQGPYHVNTIPGTMDILNWYACSMASIAVAGGAAVIPSLAVGPAMFKLGAYKLAPQYAGLFFLIYFYLTDFTLVAFIPKPAFSALVIFSGLQLLGTWFFQSYGKMSEKIEFVVVPLIMVLTYVIGMLESVGVGIAISTFVFVAAFYRSGVVKFMANGLMVHSTVERTNTDATWLDKNGDLIQILVLQNYLFFGNASSCLAYIASMFEEPPEDTLDFPLPPLPKYLVVDMMLVSGMDASAVGVFKDVASLCGTHQCQLFLSGVSKTLRSVLTSGGLKPRLDHNIKFYSDIDAALGKAEDGLLRDVCKVETRERRQSVKLQQIRLMDQSSGFRHALEQIDAQHFTSFASRLEDLEEHTSVVELKAGQCLFENHGGVVSERGIFFVENGLMRVEQDPIHSITHRSGASLRRRVGPMLVNQRYENEGRSLGRMNARSKTIGRMDALMKNAAANVNTRNFRVARIGPGWVIGAIGSCSGLRNPGLHIAVTPCRMHHLTFKKMNELEESHPALMLQLHKLLSETMARRYDSSVAQLATLHSIMTSTPATKPISRKTLGALNRALME